MKDGEEQAAGRAQSGYSADVVIGAGIRGGVGPPPPKLFIGLRGPDWPGSDAALLIAPPCVPRMAARLETVSYFLFVHVYGDGSP